MIHGMYMSLSIVYIATFALCLSTILSVCILGQRIILNAYRAYLKLIRSIPGSTPGSKKRNMLAYFNFVIVVIIFAELFIVYIPGFEDGYAAPRLVGWMAVTVSVFFFWASTIDAISGDYTPSYPLNIGRLIRDSLISTMSIIATFAFAYRTERLVLHNIPCEIEHVITPSESFYYSVITFSTLGYGDFVPVGYGRLLASFEAIIGNLHLAFIVSAIFLLMSRRVADSNGEKSKAECDASQQTKDRQHGSDHT